MKTNYTLFHRNRTHQTRIGGAFALAVTLIFTVGQPAVARAQSCVDLADIRVVTTPNAPLENEKPIYEYKILAKHSELFLDVLNQRQEDGARVGQWTQHPGSQQGWLIIPVPKGGCKFYIIARHSGKFLDVLGQSIYNEAAVGQWSYQDPAEFGNTEQQQWILEDIGQGYVKIKNANSQLYLDVLGQNTEQGALVGQWETHEFPNQQWQIITRKKLPLPVEELGNFPPNTPTLTGADELQDGETFLVDEEWIPFYEIKDKGWDVARQAARSPYYLLKTHKQWAVVDHWDNANKIDSQEFKSAEKTGMLRTTYEEFAITVGVKVQAQAKKFGFKQSMEINTQVSKTTSSGTEDSHEDSSETSWKVEPNTRLVLWTDRITFTLLRMDGTEVNSWTANGNNFTEKVRQIAPES